MSFAIPSVQKSLGVSRNLSHAFKQERKASKVKKTRFHLRSHTDDEIKSELLQPEGNLHSFSRELPPLWVDEYEHLLEDIQSIYEALTLFDKLQATRFANAFGNTAQQDSEIKQLAQRITRMIRQASTATQSIEKYQGSSADLRVRQNLCQCLRMKLQEATSLLRASQQRYMQRTAELVEITEAAPVEDRDPLGMFGDEEVASYYQSRDSGINALLNNMQELSEIFQELSALVLHQGTILDRIDYNVQNAKDSTSQAHTQLVKADKHQRATRSGVCILFLLAGILVLTIILILKAL